MAVVFEKIISIFVIILVGFVASRLGWLPAASGKYISKMLLNICMPCFIVYSMSQQSLDRDMGINIVVFCVLVLILFSFGLLAGLGTGKLLGLPKRDWGLYGFSLAYTNNGFLGYPVAYAAFGDEGLFFMILGGLMINLHNFSLGIMTVNYGGDTKISAKDRLKRFLNMPVIASVLGMVILLAEVEIPEAPTSILSMIGNVTIPLSMIFLGIQLAQGNFREMAGTKKNFVIVVLRLAVIPAIVFVICRLIGFYPMVTTILTLTAGMPVAVTAPILAEEYGRNTKLASQCVFLTTLFSLVSLPVLLWFLSMA
ncbi:MAG: AEC family transporter [Firmicutes bacterium]|nr:AEC family transporter [Bacillota bacterium]